jgi:hypothetical protein
MACKPSALLSCVAGHHRLTAFLNVCSKLGLPTTFEAIVFDKTTPGCAQYLKTLGLNACEIASAPDYFHVAFLNVISKERMMYVSLNTS